MKKYTLTLIRFAVMILITSAFIFTVQLVRRPSVDSITAMLLSLPEYSEVEKRAEPHFGAYSGLPALPVEELTVYTATDGTSREFAVCRILDREQLQTVIDVFKSRTGELSAEFAGNDEELKRIESFRIISINDFITFTVCDTYSTAENAVHEYFSVH